MYNSLLESYGSYLNGLLTSFHTKQKTLTEQVKHLWYYRRFCVCVHTHTHIYTHTHTHTHTHRWHHGKV